MKKHGRATIAALCMLLGFIVTLQLRSVNINNQLAKAATSNRLEDLAANYSAEKTKNEMLYEQNAKYLAELEQYRKEAEESGGIQKTLAEKLRSAELEAGLTDVSGPGVTVTIKDSKAPNRTGDENDYVIHHSDLLAIINDLRSAGAEAISLNDERLVSTSEIICIGSTVTVNKNPYGAPFVIRAIGNSDTLQNALLMRGGVVDYLTNSFGFEINVNKNDRLDIRAYTGPIKGEYAKPADQGAK